MSAVIERVPLTMALMRLGRTARSRASCLMVSCVGFMKSSRRISPGWMGARSLILLLFWLVVVPDFHAVGAVAVPSEADWVLIVNADDVG